MSDQTPYPLDPAFEALATTPEAREEIVRWLTQPVSPEVLEADKVFREQLPELLRTHPQQWVAYSGSRLLGFHTSQRSLYQQCLEQGFMPGQFAIHYIDGTVLDPNWLVV